jgi:hypothetical protein
LLWISAATGPERLPVIVMFVAFSKKNPDGNAVPQESQIAKNRGHQELMLAARIDSCLSR